MAPSCPPFADAYRATFASDGQRRSYGSVACAGEPATIVWGFYYFPIVKAYQPDNTLLWTALIEDFTQGPVYQNEPSTPTVHPRGFPTEYIVETHALHPGFVVLQTVLYDWSGTLGDEDRVFEISPPTHLSRRPGDRQRRPRQRQPAADCLDRGFNLRGRLVLPLSEGGSAGHAAGGSLTTGMRRPCSRSSSIVGQPYEVLGCPTPVRSTRPASP